jgi:hypothetical protein
MVQLIPVIFMIRLEPGKLRIKYGAHRHMKPGAWVELQDVDGQVHSDDGTVPHDWPLVRFCNLLIKAFGAFGTNAHAADFGRQYLEEAGFVNIKHRAIKLPYGPWPRDRCVSVTPLLMSLVGLTLYSEPFSRTLRVIGMYYRIACEEMFPIVGAIHLPLLGWSKEETEALFQECRNGLRDPKVHAYGLMHFWSGQKPLEDEMSK